MQFHAQSLLQSIGAAIDYAAGSYTLWCADQISSTPFPFNNLIDAMPVVKMGRTSCLTSGTVDAFDAIGKVVYVPKLCNVVGFEGQDAARLLPTPRWWSGR